MPNSHHNMKNNLKISLLGSIIFFLISLFTLKDYNPSWDEAVHFSRGQAYLNFFLTGKKDYSNITGRRSFYQFDYHTGKYWFSQNPGHPPVSDILAAVSNKIFYQKLGIVGDINSYHLFNILVSSFLVFVVVDFALITIGPFAALISFSVLATYPLFFAESHFNIKDPAETAFFAATIWAFYKWVSEKKNSWFLMTFLFFALAIGTKFNILFLPFIVVPYLILRGYSDLKISRKTLVCGSLGILIVLAIFVVSWPYLWSDWPKSLINVFSYYKQIGIGTRYQPESFYVLGFNTFPLLWIFFTTPPISLALFLIGTLAIFGDRDKAKLFGLLWLLWFLVPILRVSIPNTSIYGGVRQIMEFLPAFALIAGLGGSYLFSFVQRSWIKLCLTFLIFAFLLYPILKYHPNENVYFNFLIGGLKGAQMRNFPSWGNSFGNAYLQGIKWLNENAEPDSKITLIQGVSVNTPQILYRPDLSVANSYFSGIERGGEYIIELTFNDTGRSFYYGWEYVEKFLEPVYQIKVDDVSILKIWKNDLRHTKSSYRLDEEPLEGLVKISTEKNILTADLEKDLVISRIFLKFQSERNCSPIGTSFVETSLDNITWNKEKDWIPFPQVGSQSNLKRDSIEFFFAARKAKYIRLILDNENSCALDSPKAKVLIFK